MLADDLATLVWLANLAAIELHTPLARAPAMQRPTTMVFDLDPGAPATVIECCRVALTLHGTFERLGLQSFAKTSGSKGLQVYRAAEPATGHLRAHEELRPHRRRAAGAERAGAGRVAYDQVPSRREGADRLEPERRPQDHRLRTRCGPPSGPGSPPRSNGRRSRRRSTAGTRPGWRSRPSRRWNGSGGSATCSRTSSRSCRRCPTPEPSQANSGSCHQGMVAGSPALSGRGSSPGASPGRQ